MFAHRHKLSRKCCSKDFRHDAAPLPPPKQHTQQTTSKTLEWVVPKQTGGGHEARGQEAKSNTKTYIYIYTHTRTCIYIYILPPLKLPLPIPIQIVSQCIVCPQVLHPIDLCRLFLAIFMSYHTQARSLEAVQVRTNGPCCRVVPRCNRPGVALGATDRE